MGCSRSKAIELQSFYLQPKQHHQCTWLLFKSWEEYDLHSFFICMFRWLHHTGVIRRAWSIRKAVNNAIVVVISSNQFAVSSTSFFDRALISCKQVIEPVFSHHISMVALLTHQLVDSFALFSILLLWPIIYRGFYATYVKKFSALSLSDNGVKSTFVNGILEQQPSFCALSCCSRFSFSEIKYISNCIII